MEEVTIYVTLPEGFIATGEYREPKENEPYLCKDSSGDWSAMVSSRDHKDGIPWVILKEFKRGKAKDNKPSGKPVSKASGKKTR